MSRRNQRSPLSATSLAVLGALLVVISIVGMVAVIIRLGQ